MIRTYEVQVHRDGRWWMITVPALDQVTQARRIGEIEDMARSLIAISTGTALAKVAVKVVGITVPGAGDVLATARHVEQLRQQSQQLEAKAAEAARNFALALTEQGVPVRDAAALLHVSPQRVSQLVNA